MPPMAALLTRMSRRLVAGDLLGEARDHRGVGEVTGQDGGVAVVLLDLAADPLRRSVSRATRRTCAPREARRRERRLLQRRGRRR